MARVRLVSLSLLFLLCVSTAFADVMNFNQGSAGLVTISNPPAGSYSFKYTEGAFTAYVYGGNAPTFISDGHGGYAMQIGFGTIISFEATNGSLFNLTTYDFLGGGDTALQGYDTANNQVAGAHLTGLANSPQLDNTWTNLRHVNWCAQCFAGDYQGNALDNLQFNVVQQTTTTPEPGSAILLLSGIAAASLRRRTARK